MNLNLFDKSSQKDTFENKSEAKITISVIDQVNNKPIIYGLDKNLFEHNFEIIYNNPVQSGKSLLDGEIDFGIIPVTAYAKSKENWHLVPEIAISSNGKAGSVHLFFKKGIQDIKKIAVDKRADTSFALLQIIMQEKFHLTPDYELISPNLEQMLSKADAALLIGDEALHEQQINKSFFDLGEEWLDLTGLPLVYSLISGRQNILSKEELGLIKKSFDIGVRNYENISKEYAKKSEFGWSVYHDYLTQNINYSFNDQEKSGLNEFFNYAFYYGIIDYIPELRFFEM